LIVRVGLGDTILLDVCALHVDCGSPFVGLRLVTVLFMVVCVVGCSAVTFCLRLVVGLRLRCLYVCCLPLFALLLLLVYVLRLLLLLLIRSLVHVVFTFAFALITVLFCCSRWRLLITRLRLPLHVDTLLPLPLFALFVCSLRYVVVGCVCDCCVDYVAFRTFTRVSCRLFALFILLNVVVTLVCVFVARLLPFALR